ncbi:RNA polymerase sigma factor [Ulvibacterium marinum]|uniref:RNA polymerase sigma factor n=1 Tax=Ulvibacterium marinum TaxID=2419782 RepID=UPI0024944077|nr:sigma-70 family RNA polymerase sigma factor [Ulvibacterium marinum]
MADEEEFVKVIKQNERVIFKITTVYTRNEVDQQDLYQDIVYQLWKSFRTFRNESKISTWMYRIALNTALTRYKRHKKCGHPVPIEKVILQQTENYDIEFEERLALLYKQIHELNSLEKGIMLLLLEGKKYEEISEIIGLSSSNVGTRISRIKQKLKQRINKK